MKTIYNMSANQLDRHLDKLIQKQAMAAPGKPHIEALKETRQAFKELTRRTAKSKRRFSIFGLGLNHEK